MLRVAALLVLSIVLSACAPAAIHPPIVSLAVTPSAAAFPTLPPTVTATLYPVHTDTPEPTQTAPLPTFTELRPAASPIRPTNTDAPTRTATAATGSKTATRSSTAREPSSTPLTGTSVAARATKAPTYTRTPTFSTDALNPILPDLRTLPPTDLVIEKTEDNRRLLRLTNMIINWGPGVMEVVGKSDPITGRTVVLQNLYRANGESYAHPAVIFIFHLGHNHWHFENFATYQVWSLTEEGKPRQVVGVANKVSYCLQDTGRSVLPNAAIRAAYVDCEAERQGMSSGWIDTYEFDREGQEVDITELSDGVYMIRSVVDPDNRLVEWNENNNVGIVYFDLQGESVAEVEAASVPLLLSKIVPIADK